MRYIIICNECENEDLDKSSRVLDENTEECIFKCNNCGNIMRMCITKGLEFENIQI